MSEPSEAAPAPERAQTSSRPAPPAPPRSKKDRLAPPPPHKRTLPPPPPMSKTTTLPTPDKPAPGRKAATKLARKDIKRQKKLAKKATKAARKAAPKQPKAPRVPIRPIYQVRLLTRSAHPVQALVLTAVVAGVAVWDHRGVGGTLVAAGGVFLTQLALGLLNDAFGATADARAKRSKKPVAAGVLPRGNATYLAILLALASVPVAALNGTIAGSALLLTLPVGFLHNRVLHHTPASFIGWMLTFPLLATYLAYGGWGAGKHGEAPTWQILLASAALGLMCHFFTALPDLASDHAAGRAELPLVIARRTGATILLVITVICLIAAVAATVWCGLHFGLRQR